MPLLEFILIALILLSAPLVLGSRKRSGAVIAISAVGLLVFLLHLVLEGAHWQMAPAYLALLLCLISSFVRGRRLYRLLSLVSILLVLAACAFSIYLPIFKLPEPTGSYAIGTEILPLVNDHPQVPGAASADGKRPLMIQIWYPASQSKAHIAPYRILKETTHLSSYQSVIPTHARWNAPMAGGSFPVLLLNPAWNGRRTYYMYLVEDLVSHGYIVVGIDHTGNSGPTAFPDGHLSMPDPDPAFTASRS